MDNAIILVRALEVIEEKDQIINIGDVIEVNDDGEFWHPIHKPPNYGFYKRRFEIIDEPISDVWTTP